MEKSCRRAADEQTSQVGLQRKCGNNDKPVTNMQTAPPLCTIGTPIADERRNLANADRTVTPAADSSLRRGEAGSSAAAA